jgi:hypothetical protein
VRLEHRLDLRRARAAVDAADHALPLDQDQRRDVGDLEALGQCRLPIDVHADDAQARAFLPCQVREQALHPAGRA